MANPWEQFADAEPSQPSGPWSQFQEAATPSPYPKGASESRKKHSQETAPSWMPFPTAYNAVNSALSEGSHNMYEGLKGIWEGPTMERKAHSASQAVRGLGEAASPALAPALVAAPVPTIIRTLAGLAAQKGIEYGAPMVGVPQGYAELGGDITGLAAASAIPGSMPSLPNGKSVMQGAFTAADIVPAMFRPWETGAKVLGRLGKNYVEGQQVPAPPATATPRPTPSPTWSRPIPETPPPPAPKPGPSPTWARPIPAPPVAKPPKPGPSPTWSRGTEVPAALPEEPLSARSTRDLKSSIKNKPEVQAAVDSVLAERAGTKSPEPPPADTTVMAHDLPPVPTNPHELNRGLHQNALHAFGDGYKGKLTSLVEEMFGPKRTLAFTDKGMKDAMADGRTPLTMSEKSDLYRRIEKDWPSVPKPPE